MTPTLGPYEIRGKLGTGAMAVVWRAWDPKLEREVAVKEPVPSGAVSDTMARELADRFVQEGKTAARLSHPGIVTIYAADVFDGRPAIVMELLRGQLLSSLLDHGPLPPAAMTAILDQLLDALDYAHTMGVVHRDVKPDNVFVTDDGRVKLTDFGVAHTSRLGGATDAIIAGSPGYMSPEQVRGESVDGRADIFGIGAIAYEMLVGRNPFGATDGVETMTIMYRTTSGPEPDLTAEHRIPQPMQEVILRALARDVNRRWTTAGEMRAALRAAAPSLSWGDVSPVATAVDDGPQLPNVGSTGSVSTLDSLKAHGSRKGSPTWILGTAVGVTLAAVLVLALLGGQNTFDIGVLVLFGGGIAGIAWWMAKRRQAGAAPAGPDVNLFGAASGGERTAIGSVGGDIVGLRIRGPRDYRVQQVPLPCVIGRSSDAGLELDDDLASRRHALLERRGEVLWISDLGSRNGTTVDGRPASDGAPLHPGSTAIIGDTEIAVSGE